VDDILDTGRTSAFVHSLLKERNSAWLKTCMFLDKPARRVVPFRPDFVGFTVPDAFVVGYGLDFDGRYRERPGLSLVRFKDKSPEPQFSFQIREGAICLEGRLDAAGAGPLGETLMNWKGTLVLDLKELAFLDQDGADLIQKACRNAAAAGWPVKIRKASRTYGGSLKAAESRLSCGSPDYHISEDLRHEKAYFFCIAGHGRIRTAGH